MLYLIHLVTGDTIIAQLTQAPAVGETSYAEDLGLKPVHCEYPMRLAPVPVSGFFTLEAFVPDELLAYGSIPGGTGYFPVTLAPAGVLWSAPVSVELTGHYQKARETKSKYEFEM